MPRYLPGIIEEFETLNTLLNNCSPVQNCAKADNGITLGETADSVFVEVPVPGVHKDKIQLSYEKGSILIQAEENEEKNDVQYHVKSSRRYAYRIAIPTRVDDQAAPEASYKDGILRVKFHKSRAARPMKIDIK